MVFKILRLHGGCEVAIQVAVADAVAAREGQRIGDRHKGDAAAHDIQLAAVDFLHHSQDRLGAAGFIAMHRAEDDEARPGFKAVEIERFEVDVAGVNGHGRFSHAYESWKVAAAGDSVPYKLTERPPAKNYGHRCVRHRIEPPSA